MDLYKDVSYILHEGVKPEQTHVKVRKLKHEATTKPNKRYEPKKIEDERKWDLLKKAYLNYWKSVAAERADEQKQFQQENEEREKELIQEK